MRMWMMWFFQLIKLFLFVGLVFDVRVVMQVVEKIELGVCNWVVGNFLVEVCLLQEEDLDLCFIIKWFECNIEFKQVEFCL